MPSLSIFSLKQSDYSNIDERLKPFLQGWQLVENYKNKIVRIPGTWNGKIFATKYFEVVKKPGEPNYAEDESENEIGLIMECGWPGYDTEVIINLFILGKDVKKKTGKVSAEILKAGGADMKLYYHGNLVTDFTKKDWWMSRPVDKVWVDDMNEII